MLHGEQMENAKAYKNKHISPRQSCLGSGFDWYSPGSAAETRTRKQPIQGPQKMFLSGDGEIEDAAATKEGTPRNRDRVLKVMTVIVTVHSCTSRIWQVKAVGSGVKDNLIFIESLRSTETL